MCAHWERRSFAKRVPAGRRRANESLSASTVARADAKETQQTITRVLNEDLSVENTVLRVRRANPNRGNTFEIPRAKPSPNLRVCRSEGQPLDYSINGVEDMG